MSSEGGGGGVHIVNTISEIVDCLIEGFGNDHI